MSAPIDFKSIYFVMVNPSHPGNVGSTARAIKTMGFSRLVLVEPRQPNVNKHTEAISLASGATDVLEKAIIVNSLEEALAPSTIAFALTARPRLSSQPATDIRNAAIECQLHLSQYKSNARVAFVLGAERMGLSNDHIALCQRVCHIPANPDYSSLNIAQAAQLVAWELRYALISAADIPVLPTTDGAPEEGSEPATNENVQALLAHLEEALTAIKFIRPTNPRKLMFRMVQLFNRCGLSHNETNMLRGMCAAIIKSASNTKHKH